MPVAPVPSVSEPPIKPPPPKSKFHPALARGGFGGGGEEPSSEDAEYQRLYGPTGTGPQGRGRDVDTVPGRAAAGPSNRVPVGSVVTAVAAGVGEVANVFSGFNF